MTALLESNPLYATLIFDVSAVVIVLVFLIVNAKRGFSKIFISTVGYVLAIIIASVLSDSVAEPIYNDILLKQNVENVQDVLEDCDVSSALREDIKKETYGVSIGEKKLKNIISSSKSVYSAINGDHESKILSEEDIDALIVTSIDTELGEPLRTAFPVTSVNYMINYMSSDTKQLYTTASALLSDDKTTAKYIEENFIRPVVIYIIKMAIFFIVFFIVMVIVKLISKSIENNNSGVDFVGTSDAVLGAIMGIIEGCVMLILISIFLEWITFTCVDTSVLLNDSVIQDTKIFKYVYNLVPLSIGVTN